MLTAIWPILEARDVGATVDLYRAWLGFERVDSAEEEASGIFGLRSGSVFLAFVQTEREAGEPLGTGVRFYFDVDDVEAHYARAQAGGVEIVSPLAEKPYRMREYTLRDPNGYVLTFAQPLETSS